MDLNLLSKYAQIRMDRTPLALQVSPYQVAILLQSLALFLLDRDNLQPEEEELQKRLSDLLHFANIQEDYLATVKQVIELNKKSE